MVLLLVLSNGCYKIYRRSVIPAIQMRCGCWIYRFPQQASRLGASKVIPVISSRFRGFGVTGGSRRPIFCDLDGVLVDFDKGVRRVMGTSPDQLKRSDMWRGLAKAKKFYAKLDWMPDGRELWNGIVDLHPTILTGLPMGNWAEPQKREWCKKELGGDVFVITCMSRDKHIYCQYDGSVLIDDSWPKRAAVVAEDVEDFDANFPSMTCGKYYGIVANGMCYVWIIC
ncbi:unnamed protein product [Ascophyllum nodosum]